MNGVDLVGDEASSVAGTTFQKPGGAWLVGVDAFHQLHCIVGLKQQSNPKLLAPSPCQMNNWTG